jgi:hypothetical protein
MQYLVNGKLERGHNLLHARLFSGVEAAVH